MGIRKYGDLKLTNICGLEVVNLGWAKSNLKSKQILYTNWKMKAMAIENNGYLRYANRQFVNYVAIM